MANIHIAIDNIHNYSADRKTLDKIIELLKKAGHTVTDHGIGPNKVQGALLSSKNSCDLMIQVAGGKCLGTLCDVKVGISEGTKYYHAKAGGFMYYQCYSATWPAKREPRDHFSTKPGPVKNEVDRVTGRTLPDIFKEYTNMFYGYGETAEDCVKTFLANYGGQSDATSTDIKVDAGNTIIDLIRQVMTDWNDYGAELTLTGDTVNIKRTNIKSATPLTNAQIINNSISFTEYDNNTPNTYKNVKDNYLIDKFGTIPLDTTVEDNDPAQILQIAQRGHNHNIDLKVIARPEYTAGRWVNLTLEQFNIIKRPYYIIKDSYDDDRVLSITLASAPPETKVEITETATEEETTEEETTDTEAT